MEQEYFFQIVLAVIIISSTIIMPNNINAQTLDRIENERRSKENILPHFKVGLSPSDIAINFDKNIVYVANADSDSVSVININTMMVTDIPVGDNPIDISLNPVTNRLYVANADSYSVSVIDTTSNTKIKDIPVAPYHPNLIEDRNKPYNRHINRTLMDAGDYISVLEQSNGDANANVRQVMAINPVTNRLYVANADSDSVSVIDTTSNTKIKDIPVGNGHVDISIDSYYNKVYIANFENESVSVIDGKNNTKIKNIPVGNRPSQITIYDCQPHHYNIFVNCASVDKGTELFSDGYFTERNIFHPVYVLNSANVSIIDPKSNTKIKDIPVDGSSIAIDAYHRRVYLYQAQDKSLSVIDPQNNSKVQDIPLETKLQDIRHSSTRPITTTIKNFFEGCEVTKKRCISLVVDPNSYNLYVANGRGDIFVIDGSDLSKVKGIHIREYSNNPHRQQIAINPVTHMVYVADSNPLDTEPDNVFAIYDGTKKVAVGITFDVNPLDAGHIKCNNVEFPTNQYVYVDFGAKCIAEPNKGFLFSSWIENLKYNSSRSVKSSISVSDFPSNSFLSILGFGSKETPATFNVTQFGNFTANFEKLPPAIPPEYLVPLYGIIVSSIVGWSIPSIIGWTKTKRQDKRMAQFYKRINLLYNDGKLDENDIELLDKLNNDIRDAYPKGKISEQHYSKLKDEFSLLYEEIYKKKIDSLNGKFDSSNVMMLDNIKNDITDAYAKGKISEQHYSLLNKRISDYENNNSK